MARNGKVTPATYSQRGGCGWSKYLSVGGQKEGFKDKYRVY